MTRFPHDPEWVYPALHLKRGTSTALLHWISIGSGCPSDSAVAEEPNAGIRDEQSAVFWVSVVNARKHMFTDCQLRFRSER